MSQALTAKSARSALGASTACAAEAPDFDTVFEQTAPYVMRFVRRMGIAPADVDDVVQDVFLAVHRRLSSFEGRSSLRTWVYGICVFACSNHRDRAYRRREVPSEEAGAGPATSDPERALAADRALAALDDVLGALPVEQRSVFVLFEIEGLSIREVAAAAGCSKFTAYTRLYAARKRVRAALADHAPGEAT
jgi:RNA polymerase sigma-70 factor (ECF subfamily)